MDAIALGDHSDRGMPRPKHAGGRKPRTDVYRPNECPDRHAGTIWIEGRYARACPHFERVRWRCVPTDAATKPHSFTTILPSRHPRPSHPHSGETCPNCEHIYAAHEGPRTPRGFHYTITEAAAVLIAVGKGESLRSASAHARLAGLRLWEGSTAPERLTMRGVKRPRTVRQDAAAESPDSPAGEPFSIETLLDEHPPRDPAPPELAVADLIYQTFEPEPWRVPIPDPSAPTTLPRTLREAIGTDEDELEAWRELRAAQAHSPRSFWIPDLDEPLPDYNPTPAPIDRFGFGVAPEEVAALGLTGEPEPIEYRPEALERRDWASRPWGRVSRHQDDEEGPWRPGRAEHPGARLPGETTRGVSRQPILACDYINLFGPLVLAPILPTHWPEVAVIDSLPIRRGKWIEGRKIARGQKTGEIVAIIDATNPAMQTPVMVCVLGGKDRWSWLELFARLEGAPRWVVTDRDAGLEAAIEKAWPDTIHYNCEGHLLRNMHKAAIADGQPEGSLRARNPIWVAMDKAQRNTIRWDEFRAVVAKHVPRAKHTLRDWIDRNDDLVLSQMTLRERHHATVRGTGAAEAVLAHVGRVLGSRVALFRNRRRFDLVLGLICAEIAHTADQAAYAGRIRAFLEERTGVTGMQRATWPNLRDRWTGKSSVDVMLRDADVRAAIEADEEEKEKLRIDRIRRIEEHAVERALEGLPDDYQIRRRHDQGRKARRAEHRGDWLRDYPDLLAQWHPTKNGGIDPHELRAGSNKDYWWICREHEQSTPLYSGHLHEWQSQLKNRTRDGAGCRFCMRRAVCPGNSIRATHPKIADAWHPTKNEDRKPDDYISGSQVEAWFTCDRHPDYHKMIRDACKYGCPECGKERGRERHQAANRADKKRRRDLAREVRAAHAAESDGEAPRGEPAA